MADYPDARYGSETDVRTDEGRRRVQDAGGVSMRETVSLQDEADGAAYSGTGQRPAPSRESILRSYAAQDAARARDARMYSQTVSQMYRENPSRVIDRAEQRKALVANQREQRAAYEARRRAEMEAERARREAVSAEQAKRATRRTRVVPPLSTQESHDRTRVSMEEYERARASRDALSEERARRTPNREVIDGRGSVDSRALNENSLLVGYSVDERDRPRTAIETEFSDKRWRSRGGQGFENAPESPSGRMRRSRGASRSRTMSYGSRPRGGFLSRIPLVAKIAAVVVVLAVVVVAVVLPRLGIL